MNYERMAAMARRLIDKNGRIAEFVQFESKPADPAKPWLGPSGASREKQVVQLRAVFVSPSSMLGLKAVDEDLLKRCEQFVIVAPEEGAAYDLTEFHVVRDVMDSDYRVEWSEKLRPAELTLLYYLGVRR